MALRYQAWLQLHFHNKAGEPVLSVSQYAFRRLSKILNQLFTYPHRQTWPQEMQTNFLPPVL